MILFRPFKVTVLSSFLFVMLTLLSAPAQATTPGTSKSVSTPTTSATTVLRGRASWYGSYFQGKRTTSGERYNRFQYTCAHKTLPFGTQLEVSYRGKSVRVTITDRGPYVPGRDLDLSLAAARKLGILSRGVAPVSVRIV